MRYELSEASEDILSSVHYFSGDELVDLQAYSVCARQRYLANVAIVVAAASQFGLDVDTETFERWKRANMLANMLDSFLDESEDREKAYEQYVASVSFFRREDEEADARAFEWIDDNLATSLSLMQNAMAGVTEERKKFLFDIAERLGEISHQKTTCADIEGHMGLVVEEGRLCAYLLIETVSDDVRSQSGFEDYSLWLLDALNLGVLRDGMRDLSLDVDSGITSVDYSIRNKAKFAIRALASFIKLLEKGDVRKASLRGLVAYHRFGGRKPSKFRVSRET